LLCSSHKKNLKKIQMGRSKSRVTEKYFYGRDPRRYAYFCMLFLVALPF
jgi:hypothetical protein